jgi:hypothetical protein
LEVRNSQGEIYSEIGGRNSRVVFYSVEKFWEKFIQKLEEEIHKENLFEVGGRNSGRIIKIYKYKKTKAINLLWLFVDNIYYFFEKKKGLIFKKCYL